MRKVLCAALAAVIAVTAVLTVSVSALGDMFSDRYKEGKYYDALLRTSLGTDDRDNIMTVALSQKGYHEGNNMGQLHGENSTGNNGFTEYNYFYGPADGGGYAYHWSFTFIGWCAAQAGIGDNIIPRYAVSSYTIEWFSSRNQYHNASSGYIPKMSDIIFVVTDTGVRGGLVRYTAGDRVYTIEGCVNEEVRLRSYLMTDKSIAGYAAPAYGASAVPQSRYMVTTASLRVRSGPGTGYSQLGNVHEGDMITVKNISSGWAEMSFGSLSGWVSMDYIQAYSSPHTHSYSVRTVAPAGCVYGGCKLYECACGRGYTTDPTPPKGHRYVSKTVEPTCTSGGSTTYTCADCGSSYTDGITPPKGHSYTDYVTESGCTTGGSTLHICGACGDRYTDGYTDPLGHRFGDWYAVAGGLRRDCKTCSFYEIKPDETDSVTISVSYASGYVGDVIRVPVSVSGNSGLWGAAFAVEYDPKVLRLNGAVPGDVLEYAGFNWTGSEGRCSVVTENGNFTDAAADGNLAVLEFTVVSAGECELKLVFDPENIINSDGDTVAARGENASVSAGALLLGDVNFDGALNGADVMLIKRIVADLYMIKNPYVADVDRSGKLNSLDVLRLKRIIADLEARTYITSVEDMTKIYM